MNLDKGVVNALMCLEECDLGAVLYHYLHTEDMDDIHDERVRCMVLLMRNNEYLRDQLELLCARTNTKINCLESELEKWQSGNR